MILINKDLLPVQEIVLTLTELSSGADAVYTLVLHNDFTHKDFSFSLTDNLSTNTNRYDLFNLDTSLFNDLEVGNYTYTVFESDKTIETGKAKVINPGAIVQPIIYQPESTSQYITYKND